MRALLKTGRNAASLLEIIEITLNKTGPKPRDNLVEEGRIRAMKVNHSRLLNQNNELKDDWWFMNPSSAHAILCLHEIDISEVQTSDTSQFLVWYDHGIYIRTSGFDSDNFSVYAVFENQASRLRTPVRAMFSLPSLAKRFSCCRHPGQKMFRSSQLISENVSCSHGSWREVNKLLPETPQRHEKVDGGGMER